MLHGCGGAWQGRACLPCKRSALVLRALVTVCAYLMRIKVSDIMRI